jgi:hypothetical protein
MAASPPGGLVKISIGREPELVVGYQSITRGDGKETGLKTVLSKSKVLFLPHLYSIVLATNQLLYLAVLNACCGIIREKADRKPRLSIRNPTNEKNMQNSFLYPLNA